MARDKRSGELVALKKLRMERERDGELLNRDCKCAAAVRVWRGTPGWCWTSCVESKGGLVSCLLRVPLHTWVQCRQQLLAHPPTA